MNGLRPHIILIVLLFPAGRLPAQTDLTGRWETVMDKVIFQRNSGQLLQVNIVQQGNKICGYTYDSVISHPGDHCKAIFEGEYDKRRDIWILTGTKFIENSGNHVFMRIKLWKERRDGKDKLESEIGLKSWPDEDDLPPPRRFGISRLFGLEENNVMQYTPEYLQLKRVSSAVPDMPAGFAPCFPKTVSAHFEKSNDSTISTIIRAQPSDSGITKKDSIIRTSVAPPVVIGNDTSTMLKKMTARRNIRVSHITVDVKFVTLKLYDNAIVDGDTVTIFYNGKLLVSKQLLSEKPIVIDLTLDEKAKQHEIVLYAENLGSIPPNTALIVVTAGDKRYELHASASLEENAVLIFDYVPK